MFQNVANYFGPVWATRRLIVTKTMCSVLRYQKAKLELHHILAIISTEFAIL